MVWLLAWVLVLTMGNSAGGSAVSAEGNIAQNGPTLRSYGRPLVEMASVSAVGIWLGHRHLDTLASPLASQGESAAPAPDSVW